MAPEAPPGPSGATPGPAGYQGAGAAYNINARPSVFKVGVFKVGVFKGSLPAGRLRTVGALAAIMLALAGCGKKPANVGVPEGVNPTLYPRVYPNPAGDPLLRSGPPARGTPGVPVPPPSAAPPVDDPATRPMGQPLNPPAIRTR